MAPDVRIEHLQFSGLDATHQSVKRGHGAWRLACARSDEEGLRSPKWRSLVWRRAWPTPWLLRALTIWGL